MISSKKIIIFLLLFFIRLSFYAQCAMCKAVVESDLAAGGETAKGINNGILYLMAIPYLLIGVVGYLIYKNYSKKKLEQP
jgi:hypothetical protein